MKGLARLIVAAAALFALTGCPLFGPPALSFIGSELRVDSEGHFREDVVYRVGTDTFSFTEDGVYEYTEEEYELEDEDIDGNGQFGEGWVATAGERYTYTVNAEDLTITIRQTSELDNGEWVDLDPAADSEITFNAYFGDNKFSDYALVADPSAEYSYAYAETKSFDDGTREVDTDVYVLNTETLEWSIAELSEEYSSADSLIGGTEKRYSGTFTMLPEGVRFRRGETVSFRMVRTRFGRREYDTGAGEWIETSVDGSTQYFGDIVLTHMGDFLLEEGESSYRSVTGAAW